MHISAKALSVSLLSTFALLAGCAAEAPGAESVGADESASEEDALRRAGNEVRLTASDDGRTFNATVGNDVVVTLSQTASTGHKWEVISVSRSIGQPTVTQTSCTRPGCTSKVTFRWTLSQLAAGGTHEVRLGLRRPGRGRASYADTFTFKAKVAAPAVRHCGGLLGLQCAAGETCMYADDAMCGAADQTGTCQTIRTDIMCPMVYLPVCGCDGQTYGNSCQAGAAGASIAHQGECAPPVPVPTPGVCGTRGGVQCAANEFCNFASGFGATASICGADDRGGSCEFKPTFCTREFRPVMGCDGNQYSNACSANANGVSVRETAVF